MDLAKAKRKAARGKVEGKMRSRKSTKSPPSTSTQALNLKKIKVVTLADNLRLSVRLPYLFCSDKNNETSHESEETEGRRIEAKENGLLQREFCPPSFVVRNYSRSS